MPGFASWRNYNCIAVARHRSVVCVALTELGADFSIITRHSADAACRADLLRSYRPVFVGGWYFWIPAMHRVAFQTISTLRLWSLLSGICGRLRRPFLGGAFLRASASPRGGAITALPLHGFLSGDLESFIVP